MSFTVFVLDEVKPVSPGVLGFLTEVHIKPTLEYVETPNTLNNRHQKNGKGFEFIFEKINFFKKQLSNVVNKIDKYSNYKQDLVYRLVRVKNLPLNNQIHKSVKLFSVFIPKQNLMPQWNQSCAKLEPIYASVSGIIGDELSCKVIYVRLFVIEDLDEEFDVKSKNCLFVDDILFDYFNCDSGTRVLLKFIDEVPLVKEINIHTKKNYLVNVEEEFKNFLSQHSEDILVLNHDIPLQIGNNLICFLKFLPLGENFAVVDNNFVRSCKYHIVEEEVVLPLNEIPKESKRENETYLGDISNYTNIVDRIVQTFISPCDVYENVLIIGKFTSTFFNYLLHQYSKC